MSDLSAKIEDVANGPKKISGDAGSSEEHSLKELIEADRYLATKTAAAAGGTGLTFFRVIPDGTVR